MCIGFPMQVISAGADRATVRRGDEQQVIGTALVGPVQPGDWLLVFLGDAREHLDATRAAEIDATLALVAHALPLSAGTATPAPFDLPSAMSAEQLQAFR